MNYDNSYVASIWLAGWLTHLKRLDTKDARSFWTLNWTAMSLETLQNQERKSKIKLTTQNSNEGKD